MLAPLFDRMMMEDVHARFTAQEALDFLTEIDASLTKQQRRVRPVELNHDWREIGIRWKSLPEAFIQQWSAFAYRPPGRVTALLRWMCTADWSFNLISWIRRVCRL